MKRWSLKQPSTYTWALVVILLASIMWPAIMQVRGLAGFATDRPGIIESITSDQVYSANDGVHKTIDTYTFKNSTTGQTYTLPGYNGGYAQTEGSTVRLGMVDNTLVSVDGQAVDQLNFGGRFLFGMVCGLIVLAASMTATERFGKKEESKLTPVTALVASLLLAIPTAAVGIATVALSLVAEHVLHFAYWPLLELVIAIGVGYFIYSRLEKRSLAKQAAAA